MILGNVSLGALPLGPLQPKNAERHVQYKINEAEQRLARNDCHGAQTAADGAWQNYVILTKLRSAAGISRVTDRSAQPLLFAIGRLRRRIAASCAR